MCGIYSNPYEIARSLTVAAAQKIVVNQTGKTVEESNAELGRQLALVYRTILHELQKEDEVEDAHEHSHDHDHDHGHSHDHHHHGHDHPHTH